MSKSYLGLLTQRVRIEKPIETNPTDGAGELQRDHEMQQTVWANVESLSMNSRFEHFVQNIVATHLVTIRRRPDISPGYKLIWQGRTLIVRSEGASTREYQFFACEEAVNA